MRIHLSVRVLAALLIVLVATFFFAAGYEFGLRGPKALRLELQAAAQKLNVRKSTSSPAKTPASTATSTSRTTAATTTAPVVAVTPTSSSTTPTSTAPAAPKPTPVSWTTPMIAGCRVFSPTNPWNQDISKLPLNAKSATYVNAIGLARNLHPDFGKVYGIPYNVVGKSQPKVPITFTAYGDESDPGPYPVPSNAKREGGSDRHVLVLEKDSCILYELYAAEKDMDGPGWLAASGAVWNLNSDALRPEGWTSADAAGLPILPGLVRYDEVASGEIRHAIRFTAPRTARAYIHPATHHAGLNDDSLPPMGLRMRLKADYDISGFTGQAKVIATALKKYGMILADNGSSWFITGAMDSRWDDTNLAQLGRIPGNAFEAVDTGPTIKP